MRMQHPNLAKIELVAHALGGLREQLVFVGGCAVDLLLTDPAAAWVRCSDEAWRNPRILEVID